MIKNFRANNYNRMRPLSGDKGISENTSELSESGYLYYYNLLSSDEKEDYIKLKNGLENSTKKIGISSLSTLRNEKVFNAVINDSPMLFHVDGCNLFSNGRDAWVEPKYLLSQNAYLQQKSECVNKIKNI